MYEDLAVAFTPGDRGRRHGEHSEPARRQIARDADDRGRARLGIAHDAPLADRIAAGLELRLHQRHDVTAVPKLGKGRRQREPQRDEGDIGHDKIDGVFDRDRVASVDPLVHDDARVLAQAPVELTLSDVDRVHADRAALKEHVGEAAGRRPDVDGDLAGDVEAERVQCAGELVTTPRDVTGTGVDRDVGIFGDRRGSPVGAASVDPNRAREDEGLRALSARRELALHQELIKANSFCQCADSRSHSRYCAAMPTSYVRAAGIASLLAATFVLVGIGIAGVITPSYDVVRDVISASQLGPYGSLVTLGLAGGGSLTVIFASLLQRTLPPGNPVGPALLMVRGFGTLLAAAFLADIGPVRTASGFLHVVGLIGGSLAFGIGLFFLAGRMRFDDDWRTLAPYTVATALASLAILGLFVGLGPRYVGDTSAPLSSIGGLVQRLQTLTAWAWHLVIGAWLLLRPATAQVQT